MNIYNSKNQKNNYNFVYKPKPIFKIKQIYNSIIPFNVYQTWHTKNLPQKMNENFNYNKACNPKFNFILYDDNDCRDFIEKNFNNDVLMAFDKLKPGAYKADLWRYCILYINGGIYMDIKFRCTNGFKFISLTEKEHFPTDVVISEYPNEPNKAVYNGFMVSLPKNEKLLKSINQIVENVKNSYYGNSPLDITGPILFGQFFDYEEKKNQLLKDM